MDLAPAKRKSFFYEKNQGRISFKSTLDLVSYILLAAVRGVVEIDVHPGGYQCSIGRPPICLLLNFWDTVEAT